MKNIGLFYGSDTGNTEVIAGLIQNKIGTDIVDLFDMYDCRPTDLLKYDHLIIGLSTWHDGQLVSAFDEIEEELKKMDFSGKKIAFFGLGDQFGYADYFIDGVGIVGEIIEGNGGEVVVNWSNEDYDYEKSKADLGNGKFLGLALDEDNQDHLTDERIDEWIPQVLEAFGRN